VTDELDASRSSWIDSAEFDEETGTMTISLLGQEYEYSIPQELWEEFKSAPSLGSFYENFIKGKY
jgi:hypothetical protein